MNRLFGTKLNENLISSILVLLLFVAGCISDSRSPEETAVSSATSSGSAVSSFDTPKQRSIYVDQVRETSRAEAIVSQMERAAAFKELSVVRTLKPVAVQAALPDFSTPTSENLEYLARPHTGVESAPERTDVVDADPSDKTRLCRGSHCATTEPLVKAVSRRNKVLVVDKDRGPYFEIAHAIPDVEEGGTIEVVGRFNKPYKETLLIRDQRNFSIIGKGSNPVIAGDLFIDDSENITIKGLIFSGDPALANFGIAIFDGRDHRIENCRIENNEFAGVLVNGARNVTIIRNTLRRNGGRDRELVFAGIDIRLASGIVVYDNLVEKGFRDGITVLDSSNVTIENNDVQNNPRHGIFLEEVGGNTQVIGNGIKRNQAHGIVTLDSGTIDIHGNNQIQSNEVGILSRDSSVVVRGSNMSNNRSSGIDAANQDRPNTNFTVTNNTIANNDRWGVIGGNINQFTVNGSNTIQGNAWKGVEARDVSQLRVLSNTIIGNGEEGVLASGVRTKVEIRVNSIRGNKLDGAVVVDSNDVLVRGNDVLGQGVGIGVTRSHEVRVQDNVANNNNNGIQVELCSGTVDIDDNTTNSSDNAGVVLVETNGIIRNSRSNKNTLAGIWLIGSDGSRVLSNRATENFYGVLVGATQSRPNKNIRVEGNILRGGNEWGIAVVESSHALHVRRNDLDPVAVEAGTTIAQLRFNNMGVSNSILGTVEDATKNYYGPNVPAQFVLDTPFLLSGPVGLLESLSSVDLAAPTHVTVALNGGNIEVRWNGVASANQYQVFATTRANPTQTGVLYEEKFGSPVSGSPLSVPIPDGLVPGAEYQFFVTARDPRGHESWYSKEARLVLAPPKPQAPTNLRQANADKVVKIQWDPVTAAENGASLGGIQNAVVVYDVFRAHREDGSFFPAPIAHGLTEAFFFDRDPFLGDGGVTVYRYVVMARVLLGAVSSEPSELSQELRIDVGAPRPVQNVVTSIDRDDWSVMVRWPPVTQFNTGVLIGESVPLHYQVHRLDPNDFIVTNGAPDTLTNPVEFAEGIGDINPLSPQWGTSYRYKVRAVVADVHTNFSPEATQLIPPFYPSGFSATCAIPSTDTVTMGARSQARYHRVHDLSRQRRRVLQMDCDQQCRNDFYRGRRANARNAILLQNLWSKRSGRRAHWPPLTAQSVRQPPESPTWGRRVGLFLLLGRIRLEAIAKVHSGHGRSSNGEWWPSTPLPMEVRPSRLP